MQKIFWMFLLLFIPISSVWAQEGSYTYKDKDIEIQLKLNKKGRFEYVRIEKWARLSAQGNWKAKGDKLFLQSDYQIDSFLVQSDSLSHGPENFSLCINALSAQAAPKEIGNLIINDNIHCRQDQDKLLATIEERGKIQRAGTAEEREALAKTYAPLYYNCKLPKGENLAQVELQINGQSSFFYPEQNKHHKHFEFTFRLSPSKQYAYLKPQVWTIKRRKLIDPQGRKLK